jgi:hypothetical protein
MDTSSANSQSPGKDGSFERVVAFQVKKILTLDPFDLAALVTPMTCFKLSGDVTNIPKLFAMLTSSKNMVVLL